MRVFDNHMHTHYSNIRLLDSINKPKDLIDRAINIGLQGIAITDHECLSGSIEINKLAQEVIKEHPDFKIALGNEIYLTDTRDRGQKYYHFILLAKDKLGHKALRELSSQAWFNSYVDRRMERVPTLKSELQEIIQKYKGHVIATSACIGGELGNTILRLEEAERLGLQEDVFQYKTQIHNFVTFCLDLFGEDFYIECAPACSKEQITVNMRLAMIARAYGVKMCVGSDAHYLSKDERYIHKSYLNSKEGDREVDMFYEFTYLMSPEEMKENLLKSYDEDFINQIFDWSMTIYDKIENYSLLHNQTITEVPVKDYPKINDKDPNHPVLNQLWASDNIQERYWINQCAEALEAKGLAANATYWDRLEEEATTKQIIGEKLGTNLFAYPNTLQHYIDMIWDCGSIVGAGRGSSCAGLNHMLLGITQLDPIKWELPWFRYLNEARVELPDIDLDLCPSKRPAIIRAIKAERSQFFNDNINEFARNNLGCTLIATFGTETTKSAIQTACRGYRSEDFPEGIDVDEAQYLSSLVPQERGFLWPIHDVVYGNEEKDRKPSTQFIAAIKKYPGLLDIIVRIESLINKRSSHASGVIFFDKDPYEFGCFMKTPKGEIITQYDLHDAEAAGLTKYDFLVTEVSDKIAQTILLLQDDGLIDKELSLREAYNRYLHPNVLPIEDKRIWRAIQNNQILNVFQFDSLEGAKAASRVKPSNILELMDANGLMRLMTAEKGEETPMDKYVRFKQNIQLWYKEMRDAGLTVEEQKALEPYFLSSYGVPPSQEQLMLMLMDEKLCNFSLAEANAARKIVGKKQLAKIPELHQQVLDKAASANLGNYIWKCGIGPQMGYSFSKIHALAYSFIGAQTAFLATNWNSIYWNTACLIVNSGSLEDNSEEEIVDILAPEADDLANGVTFEDLPDRSGKVRKTASTDYAKVAKSIGAVRKEGIKVSLADINRSDFGFKPDAENNQILFGLKGMNKVGDDLVRQIIANRPYSSPKDFYYRINPNKQAMVSLIKGGAFDNMMERKLCMAWFIWETCDKKKRLTLQNLPGLIRCDLLPEETEEQVQARRVYEFNRYLKAVCKKTTELYQLDERAIAFLNEFNYEDLINADLTLSVKQWDKVYQGWMDIFRKWIAADKDNILSKLNETIFLQDWNKYALGNYSSWEMESLCFYYHDHELKNIDMKKYGLYNFFNLREEPEIDSTWTKNGKTFNRYKLFRIYGTCIAKNKAKSTVDLLTPTGVVTVKMRKEHFAIFDKQISQRQPDGTKKIVEKSWFNRGSMLIFQGIRSGTEFITKNYANSFGHQIYKITAIDGKDLVLTSDRYQGDIEE